MVTSHDLLSYGTWAQYKESDVTDLTPQQETQLKSLTVRTSTVVSPAESSLVLEPHAVSLLVLQVVTLCQNRSSVPYAELQGATDTKTVKELEHLIIHHCVYTGLLAAKLDQRTQQLRVFKSAPRKVSPEKLDRMIMSLSAWLDRAHDVSRFLDRVGRDLDGEAEKTAAAARARALALLAAKKDREIMERKESGADGDAELSGEGVPMKTDVMASTKKSKRKKRQMDVCGEPDAHVETKEEGAEDSDGH